MIRYIALLIVLFNTCILHAQHFSIKSLPNQSLLPVSHITDVIQDEEGYYWYATSGGGLCRDNGYQIDIVRNDRNHPGMIANNDINAVIEDRRTRSILFSTWAGVYELSKKDYRVTPIQATFQHPCFSMALDSNGRLWVCESDCILLFDTHRKLIKRISYPQTSHQSIRFYPTPDGNLWAIGNGKLFLAEDEKLNAITLSTFAHLSCIKQDGLGQYWAGSEQGILFLNINGHTASVKATIAQGEISHMTCDRRGLLWAIENKRLVAYTTHGGELNKANLSGIEDRNLSLIDGLYTNRKDQIWVYGQAPHPFILSLNNRGIINEGLKFASVPLSIYCQMTCGPYLWASQWKKPLLAFDRTNGACYNIQAECPKLGKLQYAFSRTTDGKGIWNGTDKGEVVKLWIDRNEVKHQLVTKVDSRVLATAESKNKLYIGTLHNLYVYDLKKQRLRLVKKNIGGITQMQISSDGWIYFTLEANGMGRVRDDGHCEQMFPGMILTDIVEDINHQLWVASKLGNVYRYNRKTGALHEDSLAGNENGDIIYMMETDEQGHLWILSDQHLKEYNPRTHALRLFNCTDPDIELNCLQNICLTNGLMSVAGIGGYRLIKPSTELNSINAQEANPALSGYNINGQHFLAGYAQTELKLQPEDAHLELFFTTFNITQRDKIRFKCKLEGWDKQWNTPAEGNNSIQYTNLSHGNYTLWVCATDAYGRWSRPVKLLTIDRLPSWYETWWFHWMMRTVLLALLTYCIVLYMKRWYNHRIVMNGNENEQKKLATLSKDDQEFVDKVHAIMKRHLADEKFNVDAFSHEMCMSRMNLYRKMQTIMGLSPSAFIRNERLKKAAELIKNQDTQLTEISTLVGFSSPAYFSKCFHDMYGMPPSQYAKTTNP